MENYFKLIDAGMTIMVDYTTMVNGPSYETAMKRNVQLKGYFEVLNEQLNEHGLQRHELVTLFREYEKIRSKCEEKRIEELRIKLGLELETIGTD